MSNRKAPALEAVIVLFCGLFMAISCSPIKPGESSSTSEVNATGNDNTNNNGNDDLGVNSGGASGQGSTGNEASGTGNQVTSNDASLTERYNFAAVCGPLFGMASGEGGSREGVLSSEGGAPTSSSAPTGEAGCLEGPSISSFKAVQAFAEYSKEKLDCINAKGFWDPRISAPDNPCFEGLDAYESSTYCNFSDLENKMSDVFGIDGFIEGYRNLGWQVEQCVFSPSGPYLTLSTVVIDQTQDRAHLISKVAFLESISVVCEGKSGGVCDQVANDPNAEVLFVSAPLTISTKSVADFNAIIGE